MEAKHKNEEVRKAKKRAKNGGIVSLAPPGAIWAPLQGGGAQGMPVGAIWAPLCSQKSAFAKLRFLHPI